MDVLASRLLLQPADFDRSRSFYGDVLGLAVFREWAGPVPGVVFYAGAGLVELSGAATEAPSSATRLLLQVRDVGQEHRRLAALGVPIDEAPETKPWGLVEMRLHDPDGLGIVLVEVPADHPQRLSA